MKKQLLTVMLALGLTPVWAQQQGVSKDLIVIGTIRPSRRLWQGCAIRHAAAY